MRNYLLIIMLIAIALGEDKQIITKTQTQGLGLSFSQQNLLALLGQTNVSSSIAQPSLYYILKKDNIHIEPGFSISQTKDGSRTSTSTTLGLGILYFTKISDTKINRYAGIRLSNLSLKQEYNNNDYDYEESDSENIMTISPTFGIEYLIDSNFSLGADILINYMTVEDEDDFSHIDLGSNLFFRFYF